MEEETDKESPDKLKIVNEEGSEKEDVICEEDLMQEEKITRQRQRLKEQGLGSIKIAEKAMLAAQKKNLEGNHLNSKNSFVVLNNDELVDRSRKPGG
jgi:F420-dependent methylenetetrahydromethanopterin dehydrogenase